MRMNKQLLSIGEAAKRIGVSIDTLRRWDQSGKFKSVRISPGGNRYYRKSDIDLFIGDQLAKAKNWSLSPVPFEPDPKYYCKTRDVFQARLEHFRDELSQVVAKDTASLLAAIVGEIGNNSFDHNLGNWPDILGIYFSYSLSQKRIISTDRGLGILTTLRKVMPDLDNHQTALKVAFTQTISGRAPENRGNGLKFVRNVITQNPFTLYFQTGDAELRLKKGNKDINVTEALDTIPGCLAVIEY